MTALTADQDVILVKMGEKSGTTTIRYKGNENTIINLWHRMNGDSWHHFDLYDLHDAVSDKREFTFYGNFLKEIPLGSCYQIKIFPPDTSGNLLNPILNNITPLATLSVISVLEKPSKLKYDSIPNPDETGGTFHIHRLAMAGSETFCKMSVSRFPSFTNGIGMQMFQNVEASWTSDGMSSHHEGALTPLDAGNVFFGLALVVDSAGNWDYTNFKFTTLRRKVDISFLTLTVLKDGDPHNTAEGAFTIRVMTGNDPDPKTSPANLVKEIQVFDPDNLPSINDGDIFSITDFCNIPLSIITNVNRRVQITLWGFEHDTLSDNQRAANTWGDLNESFNSLPFPNGKNSEIVIDKFKNFIAYETQEEREHLFVQGIAQKDFIFSVQLKYSVSYVL